MSRRRRSRRKPGLFSRLFSKRKKRTVRGPLVSSDQAYPGINYESLGKIQPEKKRTKKEARRDKKQHNVIRRKHRKEQIKDLKSAQLTRTTIQKILSVDTKRYDKDKDSKSKRWIFSKRNAFYHNAKYIINSTVIFILAYVIVYLGYWLTEMLMASFYGLDSTLFYYDLEFNNYSPLWTRFNILVITGVPPFLSLGTGLLLLRVIFKSKRFKSIQKLFILWWALHSISHFFGAFASGIVTAEGFGYVANWLYMNTAFKFMFSIIALFLLGLVGYYSKRHFLETSNSQSRITRTNETSFIFAQALVPWIIGTAVLLVLRIPENFNYPYETLILLSMGFAVIPAFFNKSVKPKLNLLKLREKYRISISFLLIMLVFVLFYRIMLDIGLHFIIEISISISPANM